MGVVLNQNEPSSKTTELANWISLIKVKKYAFKSKQRKNLLVDAVLSNALIRAECELRQKQQQRRLKWKYMKSTLKIDEYKICDPQTYEELNSSIDSFMLQLKDVKVPCSR